MGRSRIKPDSIPAVKDPYWTEFCRPLCSFLLEKDRSWSEVSAWGKEKKINGYFLRNALAWLEENRLVETYLPEEIKLSKQGAWVWRVTDVDGAKAYTKGSKRREENLPSEAR